MCMNCHRLVFFYVHAFAWTLGDSHGLDGQDVKRAVKAGGGL